MLNPSALKVSTRGLGIFTYSICVRLRLIGCSGGLLVLVWAVIGAGGAAAESREQAEADEPGAGGAPEKLALSRPQKPRVGGVPAQRALPHVRGTGFEQLRFISLLFYVSFLCCCFFFKIKSS